VTPEERAALERRIEAEIASDASPVGIDAKRTHVLILAKLESIERRLEALERGTAAGSPSANGAAAGAHAGAASASPVDLPALRRAFEDGAATATDAIDEAVRRGTARGIDVESRARAGVALLERLTDECVLAALGRLVERIEVLEAAGDFAASTPFAVAAITDIVDEEAARLAARGEDVDLALRRGIAAAIHLGQRISEDELESLGLLLRSDVLNPRAIELVGRLGRAMTEAAAAAPDPVGPVGAFGRLRDADARTALGFLLDFARRFGRAIDRPADAPPSHDPERTAR